MVRIFLTDDHPLLRMGIKSMLMEDPEFIVVGECGSGREALQYLRREGVDLLLLDLHLPDMDGLEVLQRVKELRPALRVLILTMCAEESMAFRLLRAGASGYVVKDMMPEELVKAVRMVSHGQRYLSTEIAAHIAARIIAPDNLPAHEKLSFREFQVFKRLAAGEPVTGIARELHLAPSTVSTYRTRIMEKLELASMSALIRYAIEYKLID
ncbi:MAG: response regulator transcription factor [Magnetococcales bacterium]|nr:response regulator transcription factor [Magnetococcales bacterium]